MNLSKKQKIIVLVGAVLVVALIVFLNQLGKHTFTIASNSGGVVWIADDKSSQFTELGPAPIEYSTKQDGPVFIEVRNEEGRSRTSVDPSGLNGQTVAIDVKPTQDLEEVYESALIDPLTSKGVIYGINGATNTLVSAGLNEFVPPKAEYIGLPFLSEIYWKNPANFIYLTLDDRVGLFSKGENLGFSYFGTSPDNDWFMHEGFAPSVSKVSQHPGKPLVLLTDRGIFTSRNLGIKLDPLTDVEYGSRSFLGNDESYIYYATYELPTAYASETEDADSSKDDIVPKSNLYVYDYEGNLVFEKELTGAEAINGVVYKPASEQFIVAGNERLFTVDSEGYATVAVYSPAIHELIGLGDNSLVIAEDGIWSVDDNNIFYLISPFTEGSYIENSASIVSGGSQLIFSTTASTTYRLDFE